jgi:hypothetical protein
VTFKTEFPDFPEADMPALPEGFSDTSWHNDACPSYSSPSFHIFIDYADVTQREHPNTSRFTVSKTDDDEVSPVLDTDNWSDVLEFIVDEATIESVMAKLGLNILTDDSEPRCGRMYHIMQGDRRIKLAYDLTEARDFILSKKDEAQ